MYTIYWMVLCAKLISSDSNKTAVLLMNRAAILDFVNGVGMVHLTVQIGNLTFCKQVSSLASYLKLDIWR